MAEVLRKRVEKAIFSIEGAKISITFSGGIGTVKPGEETSDELFDRANEALSRAKSMGRNRILSGESDIE